MRWEVLKQVGSVGWLIEEQRSFRSAVSGGALSAEPKPADDCPVPSYVLSREIPQETAALPDQLQETSARGVVFVVPAEVIGQAAYTLGEKRYLHFRGAGVARLRLVLSDDALLGSCIQHVPSRGT